jgi:hypothetical protein
LGTDGVGNWTYADHVRPIVCGSSDDRLVRIERVIEHYRVEKKRRLLRRAIRLWRKLEAQQVILQLEKPLDSVH